MKFGIALGILTLSLSAFAGDLKDKKTVDGWNKTLGEGVALTTKKCGFPVAAKMEDGFLKAGFVEARRNAGSYCSEALSGIRLLCDNATAKSAVQAKIKNVSCKPGQKDEVSFKIAGDTLEFTVGPEGKNLYSKAKKYLEDNL